MHGLRVKGQDVNFCGEKGCVGIVDSGSWGFLGDPKVLSPLLDAAEIFKPELPCDLKTPPVLLDLGLPEVSLHYRM